MKKGTIKKFCEEQEIKEVVDALVVPKYPGLDIKKFALAWGIFGALTILITSVFAMRMGIGLKFIDIILSLYPGYNLTFFGVLIGIVYGFFDGLISGAVFAWIYNFLLRL